MTVPEHFRGTWRDGWFVVPLQVLFRDIDAYGHVNNAVFFTYFEWGRTLTWFDVTDGGISGEGGALDIGFIVAHAECDFRQQLAMEPIEVWTRFGELRTSSLDFICEIRRSGGTEIAATGKVVVVLYDWARRSKIPISDALRRKIEECSRRDAS